MRANWKSRILSLALLAFSAPAWAGGPRCYLHGIIVPENGDKASISDMIRMHFDADNKHKCELMMKNYCQYNIYEKDYSPVRLKGSFKPDASKPEETVYHFDRKCKLLKNEDE
jgi:hypothetical protein